MPSELLAKTSFTNGLARRSPGCTREEQTAGGPRALLAHARNWIRKRRRRRAADEHVCPHRGVTDGVTPVDQSLLRHVVHFGEPRRIFGQQSRLFWWKRQPIRDGIIRNIAANTRYVPFRSPDLYEPITCRFRRLRT